MNRRLHVLLSAYSCEPGKGSEPEVGWQWARQMARFHDVTVLTRANNERTIMAGVPPHERGLRFVYHDLSAPLLRLKKQFGWHSAYYRWWQDSARGVIERLCRETRFDLVHHVTYAGARFPHAIGGHGVPAIWGPVGGMESLPSQLLPWRYPRELGAELLRNAANFAADRLGTFRRRAGTVDLAIASTRETAALLRRAGMRHRLLPAIGVQVNDYPMAERVPAERLRLLFAGRLLYWKGVELALQALQAAGPEATLAFAGEGRFLPRAQALVGELGLRERVHFLGHLPRAALLALYRAYDALLFPSLHDTGGFVLLEAMASELPVICLDCAGPALAVGDGCGFRVPLGSRAAVVAGLAASIRTYVENQALRRIHGRQARVHVAAHYDWDRKGEAMNAIYQEVLSHERLA